MDTAANINPVDALWSIIMSQPKKVREALSARIIAEKEAADARKKTLKAIEDARAGRMYKASSVEDLLAQLES
ncbi:MAG: hypothetical protein MJY81_06875 [Bacteroidaceae bacterium]|mgnify:CR=1 FL=1|nr:hypothetical protein [Bacteroidaceae bacterium]